MVTFKPGIAFLIASHAFVADAEEAGNPLKKVVTMITEMKATTEKEADEDEKAYGKYECWCTTNEKEKTGAIEEAENRLDTQNSFVEEATAKSGELKTQIETLTADIADDTDALETAAAIRGKEADEFQVSEAALKETLGSLTGAVDALSMLQKKTSRDAGEVDEIRTSLAQVRRVVERHRPEYKDVLQKDLFDVLGSLEDPAPKQGAAFLSDPSQGGAAQGSKSYNSRSGAIFGVLEGMQEQTARDLKNAQTSEAAAAKAFARLKAAKESEIAAATGQKDQKETELADLTEKLAKANEDIVALTKAKTADEEFLANLQESCAKESKNYDARVKVRSEEIVALGETLDILTADEARDLFGKTMSFMQISSSAMESHAANRVMKKLAALAQKHGSWSMASLAVRVKLDGFEKIKKTMDNMLAELKKQQKEEYDKNEACKKDIDETEDNIKVATNEKEDLAEKHKAQTNDLSVLAEDIKKLKQDVSDMEVALKQAGEERKAENALYQQSMSDQRATIAILNKALARLEEFYGKAELMQVRMHRQEPGAAAPPPPPTPKAYAKRPAGGVLGMIQMIVKDAQKTEQEMETSENQAQADYVKLVAETSASIDANNEAIETKEAALSSTEGEKAETQEAQLANEEKLKELNDLLTAHHSSCDWVMKYFDLRQQSRQEEIDGIEEAKAILSGAKFGASASFEQQKAEEAFDDQ